MMIEGETNEHLAHQIFHLQLRKDQNVVKVRSNFDSGNMAKAQIGLNNSIIVTPANDCAGTEYESHAKGWFYFGVSGLPLFTKQKFIVRRVHPMGSQTKFSQYFKPVYRYEGDEWMRIEQAIIFNKDDDNQLHFDLIIEKNAEIFIAFTFPFSYQQEEKIISIYKTAAKMNKTIYYSDQIIIKSPLGRNLHLLTITSHDHKLTVKESPISQWLFPHANPRPNRFKSQKKVILITARVHPSQAPSSHVMNGIIGFLLSKDARAEILRKNYVFNIIPMLNPDGVYLGHHRMDALNQNLNRFYLDPHPLKQPSAFAVRKIGEYFKLEERLCFYIDLHAHPQKKGNFIYGNAFENPQDQVATQVFPKLLSLNCIEFDYENSCFSKNHMSMKDKHEDLTKQGCGRVVFNRILGQVYSYTLECGYTCSNYLNELCPISNPHRKFEKFGILHDDLDNIKSSYYSNKKICYFTIKSYQNLGKSILVSILDLFQKNPYSRLPNTLYKDMGTLRNSITEQLNKGNKDFKLYAPKLTPPVQHQPVEGTKKPINRSMIGKSVPKRTFRKQNINKSTKLIDAKRRQTLPKMKTYKM